MLDLLLGLLLGIARVWPAGPAPCEVHLVLTRQPAQLAAHGVCRSLLDQPAYYRYELLARRWGQSSSRSSQSGTFALGAHQEAPLAQLQVPVAPTDHYLLRLRVYDAADRVVAQDSARQDP